MSFGVEDRIDDTVPEEWDGGLGLLKRVIPALTFLVAIYLFFCSIDLMSGAFKLAGRGFAEALLNTTSDPLAGLIIGFLATSLIQSSSTTTSIVVGLAAAGVLDLRLAIPIVMGANVGTTVTNTIVSLGHVTRKAEFRRAFAAATVHDFFNILAVITLFPIEMAFHPIEKTAVFAERLFTGVGGVKLTSPLKAVVAPVTHSLIDAFPYTLPLLLIALFLLFFSVSQMVKVMRRAVFAHIEQFFTQVLFANSIRSFSLGAVLTATVQSSSATTSLVVPLAGTGMLTVRQIFPYTLGANVGTTITAILAALATANPIAITVGLAHLAFNIFGIVLLGPLSSLPIRLAEKVGVLAGSGKRGSIIVFLAYLCLYAIPITYLVMR